MDNERTYIPLPPKKKQTSIFFCSLEKQSGDNSQMPSMDGENNNMLEAMYADMDPSTMSANDPNNIQPPGCETR
jgi:hypothetical protein